MTTAMKTQQQHQKFALRDEIRLAGLVDQLGDIAHRLVHGQILESRVDRQAEEQTEDANENAPEEKLVAVDAAGELNGGKIGKLEAGLAARFAFRLGRQRARGGDKSRGAEGREFAECSEDCRTTVGPGVV